MTLEIQNLHVEVNGQEIIKGISLVFEKGKVHALMGPNGSGKSTLVKAIIGHPSYAVTSGKIILNGQDITEMKPEDRAKAGLFLSFQHPVSVPGVTISNFLRMAVNARREKPYSPIEFHKLLKAKMQELGMKQGMGRRYLNEGFSGGEKKRAEILQMLMLEPNFAILDEPDSGTDVDALKIISEEINIAKNKNNTGILLITHYNRILKYLRPDKITVISEGRVVDSGGAQLATEIESSGFKKYSNN